MAAAVLVGCSDHRVQELDVPGFHALLTHQDTAVQVEKILIEPRDRDGAEYVVFLKNTPVRRVVHAGFPGTFVDEIYDAGIPYAVKPKTRPSVEKELEMDATTLRRRLRDPGVVAQIASIRAEPLGQGAARYVVMIKGNPVPRIVYAEYPGAIVTAIQAAKVPYTVASE
ncbi:MAG TPA: hypothetical protein VF516_25680 [Kofleriaceae bacterium]